jgi:hypothetical protein
LTAVLFEGLSDENVVAASIVAEAFTASDAGGALTKITEVGVGCDCVIGGKPPIPHPANPAIEPRAIT